MKRILGRKIMDEPEKDFGHYTVKPVNFDLLDTNAVHFRFRWVIDYIQQLRNASIITYNTLDIGAHDGTLGALIARMKIDPDQPDSNSPSVDLIESYPSAVVACETLAKSVCDHGFKMQVYNTTFENFNPGKLYDVITAFEILEHTRDPMFCIEKIYDMLEIGGHLFISIPEERGAFGLNDKNPFHYWTATTQSLISTLFYDDRKWKIVQMFDETGLIHLLVKKTSYQA
jgi:2-polyprenyl-3-methyl-5-hydroxy-6-metoxy-1,4-benzoquinol methylase